jgi:hypothetical protein
MVGRIIGQVDLVGGVIEEVLTWRKVVKAQYLMEELVIKVDILRKPAPFVAIHARFAGDLCFSSGVVLSLVGDDPDVGFATERTDQSGTVQHRPPYADESLAVFGHDLIG